MVDRRFIEFRIGGWRISGGATVFEFVKAFCYGLAAGLALAGFVAGTVTGLELYLWVRG